MNSTAKMCALSVLNVNWNLKCELLTIPRNLAAFLRTLFPLLLMAVQSTDWFWSALSSSQQFLLFCKLNRRHISNACGWLCVCLCVCLFFYYFKDFVFFFCFVWMSHVNFAMHIVFIWLNLIKLTSPHNVYKYLLFYRNLYWM